MGIQTLQTCIIFVFKFSYEEHLDRTNVLLEEKQQDLQTEKEMVLEQATCIKKMKTKIGKKDKSLNAACKKIVELEDLRTEEMQRRGQMETERRQAVSLNIQVTYYYSRRVKTNFRLFLCCMAVSITKRANLSVMFV